MLLLVTCCSIIFTAMVVVNRRNPGAQAARPAGLTAQAPQPGRTAQTVQWIVENKFANDIITALWPHHPTPFVPVDPADGNGNIPDTHTVATRLMEGLTWLKTALLVGPSDLIVHDEELRGCSHFTRTEKAFLNGLVAIISVKIVYGNRAILRPEATGGLVQGYISRGDFSANLLSSVVQVIFETLNIENHKGWVLNLDSIRRCNYGNFMKNMMKRGREGIYSDAYVLDVMSQPTHENFGDPVMVRGLYYGYYKILCMIIRGFHKKVTEANRGAYVTAEENASANWIAIHTAAFPF